MKVKVITEPELLSTACEQFLGKTVHQIENIILQTLEGHLRAILGTLTVEEIYQVRRHCIIRIATQCCILDFEQGGTLWVNWPRGL